MQTKPDEVDRLVEQWRAVRPDVDPTPMAEVGRLLRVAALITRSLEREAAAHGIDRAQGDVLFALFRAGPPHRLSPTALARATLVTTGTMTNRIDRLEARGLVRRVPDPQDRRRLEVELTPEAVRLVDAAVERHVAREDAMLAPLGARDRAALQRALRVLLAHLGAEGAEDAEEDAGPGRPQPRS